MSEYDVIIVGGGHNGLVSACYLSQAGLRVAVLEARKELGGCASSEEVLPGFKVNTGYSNAALLRPRIVRDLKLAERGLEFLVGDAVAFSPLSDGQSLAFWTNPERTRAEIGLFSQDDASRFPEFCRLIERVSSVLSDTALLTPPRLEESRPQELIPWARLATRVRRLGKRDMMEFLRVLPMGIDQLMEEWFENDAVKGLLGAAGLAGGIVGPRASGTVFILAYQNMLSKYLGYKPFKTVKGGIGRLSKILADVAREAGATIRTESRVASILVEKGQARGVSLANGEELRARAVVSNCDPRRTLFELVGPPQLEPRVMRRVRNIRFRGCTASLHLALSRLPRFTARPEGHDHLTGAIVIAPDLDYLERAGDDARYGRCSASPYLEATIPTLLDPSLAPPEKHLMSISMMYAPYHLKDASWEDEGPRLEKLIVETISQYAPNLADSVIGSHLITPQDWESDYGLTEGNIFQGEMGLDQMLFMRPIPDFARYRMPIDHLFLCGAGAHPGGGITGVPGYNAAREVLRDFNRS